MIEKLKTVILTLLVVLSLFQSYLLAYNKPDLNLINAPEYVRSELIGASTTLEQLIQPRDIILHFGEGRHTVLYPEEYFFTMVMERLSTVQLTNLERVILSDDGLTNMRNERLGFEVRFHVPVKIQWANHLIGTDTLLTLGTSEVQFEQIFFTVNELEQVQTYLIAGDTYYRVQSSNMSISDVEMNVTFGQYGTLYTLEKDGYYKPAEAIDVAPLIEVPYTHYTSEQLRNSLFVNPRSTLSNRQRDNTEFIMDGKRLLQIDHTSQWMTYSDPSSPPNTEEESVSSLSTALAFVNQNGGWSGKYLLHRLPMATEQTYQFTQYFESLPIISTEDAKFGSIEVTMNEGVATGYERSLINPEWTKVKRESSTLVGGEQLDQLLQTVMQRASIEDLFPAYEPIVNEESIEFIPRWVVELGNGTYEFLDR